MICHLSTPPYIYLRMRRFIDAPSERDSKYKEFYQRLSLKRVALIYMDMMDYTALPTFNERVKKNIQTKILTLTQQARSHRIPIVHNPHDAIIPPELSPLENEFVLESKTRLMQENRQETDNLHRFLQSKEIATLIYAGYATNRCILFRPSGMFKMKELGYRVVLLRDCTEAIESPESYTEKWMANAAINMIESFIGATTTLTDLTSAFIVAKTKHEAKHQTKEAMCYA